MRDSAEHALDFPGGDRAQRLVIPTRNPGLSTDVASDNTADPVSRDIGLWSMLVTQPANMLGTLRELASNDANARLRRSAAWALFKAGARQHLAEAANAESDSNVGAWKLHLLREMDDDLASVDDRQFRQLEGKPFDFTMPLEIQGFVEFRDESGEWRTIATGPIANERLVGEFTQGEHARPDVNARDYQREIILQQRRRDVKSTGGDYVEGYRLAGFSRQISPRLVRHQYEGVRRHEVFVSGRVGDSSRGVYPIATASLVRSADTVMGVSPDVATPFPVSVRGSFRDFVYVDPYISQETALPLDGHLQIASPSDLAVRDLGWGNSCRLVNGVFYGTFRGVVEDLDGDGKAEVNGVEMLVNGDGDAIEPYEWWK